VEDKPPPGGSPRQVPTHVLHEGVTSRPSPCRWRGRLGAGGVPCTRLCFPWRGEPAAPGCSPSSPQAAALRREPDIAPGPALAGIPARSWGAARCSRRSGEPLGDPPTPPLPVKGHSSPSSPQGLLPSLPATVSLPAQLNMKHKPGWVTARGSRACQPRAKEETHSLLSWPQASLLTSAESGPALPVVFDLSILLEQQGAQLLHLVLQRQAHLNQGPHEVTGHLGWRRDTLGEIQGCTQLSTEWSKQGSQQGPSKSCTPGHIGLPKIPHVSPKPSGKRSKDMSWEKGSRMLRDTSPHPFTAGACSRGELVWESPVGTGCRGGQCSTCHLGCSRRQRAPHVPPRPSPQLCAPQGKLLCRKQLQLGKKPEGPKVSNCGSRNRRDFPREARPNAAGIPACRTHAGCSSPLQPIVPTRSLGPHKARARPLPRSQAGPPWPGRHMEQPPSHRPPQPPGGHLGSPAPAHPLSSWPG